MMMRIFFEARKKIIGIVALLLLGLLMMNLNSRLGEYFHLTTERDKLNTQVVDLYATKAVLETQVAYATSDAAVEDWARNEAHMARPGDQVIIPVTPAGYVPEQKVEVTATPRVAANWEVWQALFLGE